MASTYSNLKIELIGTGEQAGAWGITTNNNLGTALEEAIVGRAVVNFTTDADLIITLTNTNTTQVARHYALQLTSGVSLTTTRNLTVPSIEKPYIIKNATTGGQSILVKTAAGTGVTVPNGKSVMVYVDSVNVLPAFNHAPALSLTTDLAIIDGGTGASDAPGARSNLGISAANTPNTPSGNLSATDVQGALNELQTDVDTRAVASTVNAALALRVSKTSDTGSAIMPNGTSAQRDGAPVAGYLRYNATINQFEGYNGSFWGTVGGGASGGAGNAVFYENDTLVTENYTLGQGALVSGVTVNDTTNLFTLTAHGFIADQLVQFSTTTTLPAPLVAATGYYVLATDLTANDFKISLTQGGSVLDITTTGTGTHSVGKLKNAASTGTIAIATSKTVIVPTNATWSIN